MCVYISNPVSISFLSTAIFILCLGVFQMEEESQRFVKERADRIKTVQERHNREVEEFDVQSATLGMDALHIAEATQDSYEIDDGDSNSVRGSVLSLTPSTSTNSFTHTHTQL